MTFPSYFQVPFTLKGKGLFRVCIPVGENLGGHLRVLFITLTQALRRPGTSTHVLLRVLRCDVRSLAILLEKPCGETIPGRERPRNYSMWGKTGLGSLRSHVSSAFQPSLPKWQTCKWAMSAVSAQLSPLKTAAAADIMWSRRTIQLSPVNPMQTGNVPRAFHWFQLSNAPCSGREYGSACYISVWWETCLLHGNSP